jgi:hypothetical protein
MTETAVMAGGGFTVTVAAPDLVESCVLVAVIVALPEAGIDEGAVYKPELVIVPESADQVTAELKFPVPVTATEHWLVCPVCMFPGLHVTVTELIVGALPPPPPPFPLPPPQAHMKKGTRNESIISS